METRLPSALETAEALRGRYLLGWTRSRTDSAQSGENLCGSVHIECLRNIPSSGNGQNSAQSVALRRFCKYTALCLSLDRLAHGPHTLHHVSVLHPCANSGCVELSLVLDAKTALCVEQATMDIAEL